MTKTFNTFDYIMRKYYRNLIATKIQSLWRTFKQRKLLNRIYKRLPDDLQYKILCKMK